MKNQKEIRPCKPSKSRARVVDILHSEQTRRRPSTVTSGYRVKKVTVGMCPWIMWRCGSWLNRGMAGHRTLSFSAARIKKGRRASGSGHPAETWHFIGRLLINLQRCHQNGVVGHADMKAAGWPGIFGIYIGVYMNCTHVEFKLHV